MHLEAYLLASAPNIGWRLWLALHQSAWNITNHATCFPDACADDLTVDWNSPAVSVDISEGSEKTGYCTTSEQAVDAVILSTFFVSRAF